FLDDLNKRDYQAVIMGWTGVPIPNPKQIWHSKSEAEMGSNHVGYNNPKVDELIEKANQEMDLKKRGTTLQEINRIIYEDQPYTFLTESRSVLGGFSKNITAQ